MTDELAGVRVWRCEQLVEVGYPPDAAFDLGKRFDVDLHLAIELVREKGCPPETAAAILL